MSASEFHKEWRRKNPIADWMTFAEAYHKHRVESVTDEDISNQFTREVPFSEFGREAKWKEVTDLQSVRAVQWFKNELLKL